MAQITRKFPSGCKYSRREMPKAPSCMEYHTRGDKRVPIWKDSRRPGLVYKSRFELTPLPRSLVQLREEALNVLRVSRYTPLTLSPTATYLESSNVNKARSRKYGGLADYMSGFLGFRVHRYRLGADGAGGDNPFSLVVHSQRDFDVYVEDSLRFVMVEFSIAHEIGHYVLHSSGGRVPTVWPRMSPGLHDAEASVFAGCMLLPDFRIDEIFEQAGGSVLEAAYAISEIFLWWRFRPKLLSTK